MSRRVPEDEEIIFIPIPEGSGKRTILTTNHDCLKRADWTNISSSIVTEEWCTEPATRNPDHGECFLEIELLNKQRLDTDHRPVTSTVPIALSSEERCDDREFSECATTVVNHRFAPIPRLLHRTAVTILITLKHLDRRILDDISRTDLHGNTLVERTDECTVTMECPLDHRLFREVIVEHLHNLRELGASSGGGEITRPHFFQQTEEFKFVNIESCGDQCRRTLVGSLSVFIEPPAADTESDVATGKCALGIFLGSDGDNRSVFDFKATETTDECNSAQFIAVWIFVSYEVQETPPFLQDGQKLKRPTGLYVKGKMISFWV